MAVPELVGWAGLAAIGWVAYKLLLPVAVFLYTVGIGRLCGMGVRWRSLGGWAVVTGSTDGIGKEYAKQLASKGFHIVLISRSEEKLKRTAEEIEKTYRVSTRIIVADFSHDLGIYKHIQDQLSELDVTVLVNNVGMCYDQMEYFNDLPGGIDFVDKMIKVNIYSCVMMTKLVLPGLLQRKKGVILNIASLGVMIPLPLLTLYFSTKAFVDYFSCSLQEEYKYRGIVIQSVLPSSVATKMVRMLIPASVSVSPESYVRWELHSVGLETRTAGHPFHTLQRNLLRLVKYLVPSNVVNSVTHVIAQYLRGHYIKSMPVFEDYGVVAKPSICIKSQWDS